MGKNIVLCFDGTWNRPDLDPSDGDENTNVWHFYKKLETNESQIKWYDKGVGSEWYNRFSGGVFGRGLSENIRQGYLYLTKHYQPGDKVFLMGFSRGAFTARSLAGMVYRMGLLKKQPYLKSMVDDCFHLYYSKNSDAQRQRKNSEKTQRCPIEMIGVWDTVGALGIPLSILQSVNDINVSFHDCKLNNEVKNAYHLLAVDEERDTFSPTLWDEKNSHCKNIKQLWFSGAHSDVGGGYKEKGLSNITLNWMIESGKCHGLQFKNESKSFREDFMQSVHDSYAWWFGKRSHREISNNAKLHPSSLQKLRRDFDYQTTNAELLRKTIRDIVR